MKGRDQLRFGTTTWLVFDERELRLPKLKIEGLRRLEEVGNEVWGLPGLSVCKFTNVA